MRKAIQLFLTEDETQEKREEAFSPLINKNFNQSLMCFKRIVPSIYTLIRHNVTGHHSVYINRDSEIDIVEYESGNVFYGANRINEISAHVNRFFLNPHILQLDTTRTNDEIVNTQNFDGLVVMGVGLGTHIYELIKQRDVKHLVVYEPSLDFLSCSLYTGIWPKIFDFAEKNNVSIYLQVPNGGKSLYSDLSELKQAFDLEYFAVYFHYHNRDFDDIFDELVSNNWSLSKDLRETVEKKTFENYLPKWPPVVDAHDWQKVPDTHDLFERNIKAFEKYFPEIASEFKNFKTTHWQVVVNENLEVNVKNASLGEFLLGNDPVSESEAIYRLFRDNPSKDELILGYAGGKLSPYYHHQTVMKVQKDLRNYKNENASLDQRIKSVLMFGLGVGYQLASLLEAHHVEKLFLYEPNRDFFYASLFAIDWQKILEEVDASVGRIYLNIGDDGSNLVQDFLTQFHNVGTYHLANTYLFKSYDNDILEPTLSNLREDLKLIVGLGDNFENSRYIISHSKWAVEHKVKFLLEREKSPRELKDVPVFVVGNGPSLDGLFPLLKAEREKVIVVSCGTALQALHKHNIVPDYHADIEVNRSTFDWTARIKDRAFLKQVKLISGNGVHPDTASLYKDVFLSLKSGEAATLMLTSLMREVNFSTLKNSYPTVSNFAIDFIVEAGFKQIYLLGVDMGFVDLKHHHSKHSGYYTSNGKELYDYQKENNTSIVVEGNLRPYVKTKYEFKMSKAVIERTLSTSDAEVYNLNDGAKIKGTIPLDPKNVLITSTPDSRKQLVDWLENEAFQTLDCQRFRERFVERINNADLLEGIEELIARADGDKDNREVVEKLILEQRKVLFDYYRECKPIVLYYLNGSVNYINTALSKALNIMDDIECLELVDKILNHWREFLITISQSMRVAPYEFDFITSFPEERQKSVTNNFYLDNGISVSTKDFELGLRQAASSLDLDMNENSKTEIAIVKFDGQKGADIASSTKICYFVFEQRYIEQALQEKGDGDTVVYVPDYLKACDWNSTGFESQEHYICYVALLAITCHNEVEIVVPKLPSNDTEHALFLDPHLGTSRLFDVYEAYHFLVFSQALLEEDAKSTGSGDRFRYVPFLKSENLVIAQILVCDHKKK
jgi:hypothetical protein